MLFCVDGYYYTGKQHGTIERIAEIAARIPSLARVVVVPYLAPKPIIDAVPHASYNFV